MMEHTFAAHIHNELQDVLLVDLIREIGALVLDTDNRSASVATAARELRDSALLEELKNDYRVVFPTRVYNEQEVGAELTSAAKRMIEESDLRFNLNEFASLYARLPEFEKVLRGDTAELLVTARNKAVAHYDVVRDGADWKMWRVGGTGLTYGQLDAYIDECTSAIELLTVFALRQSRSYGDQIDVSQRYVDDYIAALVTGLRQQHVEEAARMAKLRHTFET